MNRTDIHESKLPPVMFLEHMCLLLGMSVRTLNDARKRRAWPFTELPRIDARPRWSRDQVLAVINGQTPRARAAGR